MEIETIERQLQTERDSLEEQLSAYKKEDPYMVANREPSPAVEDSVTEIEGHDRIVATRIELKRRLAEVVFALNKIDKGKFGVCEKCGKEINEARLKVLPTARFCLNCEGKSRN